MANEGRSEADHTHTIYIHTYTCHRTSQPNISPRAGNGYTLVQHEPISQQDAVGLGGVRAGTHRRLAGWSSARRTINNTHTHQ